MTTALVTTGQVQAQLTQLSADQIAALPAVILSASDFAEKYCNRIFSLQTYTETIIDQPFASSKILLKNFPLARISRCSAYPCPALYIQQTDMVTNQRATAELVTSGDLAGGLPVTGLKLSRWASAVQYDNNIAISAGQTIAALAASVVALGYGWKATVGSGASSGGFSLWGTTELIPPQGAGNAFGSGAAFQVYSTDLNVNIINPKAGIIEVVSSPNSAGPGVSFSAFGNPFGGGAFTRPGETGYPSSIGGSSNGIRITYDAGFATIPEGVQQAVIALIQTTFDDVKWSQKLVSQTLGAYSYTLSTDPDFIPSLAIDYLEPYVNRTVK